MITIAEVADRVGAYLHRQTDNKYDLKKICYGVEVCLVFTLSFLIMVLMGSLLGTFEETILVVLASFIMKSFTGGPHLSGYFRCVSLSSLIIVCCSYAASKSELWLTDPLLFLIGLNGILILMFYLPNRENFSLIDSQQAYIRKNISLVLFIAVWLMTVLMKTIFFYSILLGFLIPIVIITPIGKRLVCLVEKYTKRR
ncbi:MAG TPA: accessory gene regulator B family protein [Bacillota bacterium]|nr:accessory gene regulator B family protein [Bacillota bacterium]HOL10625.1 accessory gene regulator B family protein [Bacillota bacterium]HPO98828.1 accessory gene regulator B family protein [Bacillota bacterium]